MPNLSVEYLAIEQLKPRANNPRTHSKKQIDQICRSIREFGFVVPILIEGDGTIIAGHGRIEAAKKLGMKDVPTVRVDHMTPAQVRAYVIADNKLTENGSWDRNLLAIELKELTLELDYDVTLTGFDTPELDVLFEELEPGEAAADQVAEADRSKPAVSRPGDLWSVGDHLLLCGNALDPDAYVQLLDQERAQMVFVDPPYNVPINGHVSGLGKTKHREFAMASGEMSEAEFTGFLAEAFQNLARHSADGSLHFIAMDWRHIGEVLSAGKGAYSSLMNLCVWAKSNGGMGGLYRSRHELFFVYKNGTASHINNVELGKHGRYRTNVWEYPGVNTFGKERDAELKMHPTVKPVALVADAIKDASCRGDIVLDAFAGSGTTLIAAQKTGRKGRGIEIDPHYCDVILQRFADTFGVEAMLTKTGESFEAMRADRSLERQGNVEATGA